MSVHVTGAPKQFWGHPDSVGPGRPRKVAIIGSHSESVLFAPYRDPSWEIWAHSSCAQLVPKGRPQRLYDLHPRHVFQMERKNGFIDYYQYLKDARNVEIWMAEAYAEIPCAKRYPIETILDLWPDEPLRCQTAQMIAHALYEGVTDLGFWGVHYSHRSDLEEARENAAMWIGIAKGMGVRVRIAKQSPLCRKNPGDLYAYETHSTPEKYAARVKQFMEDMRGNGGLAPGEIKPCDTPEALARAAAVRARNELWIKAMRTIPKSEEMPDWLLADEALARASAGLPPMTPHLNPEDDVRLADELVKV